MINILATILVLGGLALLILALKPVHQLIRLVPAGPVRSRWWIVLLLLGVFILGYLLFMIISWGAQDTWKDLVVPVVFLFGAVFVWILMQLSLQTAADVRRVVLLEQENITDPLMGIYNRRYLDRRLDEECSRALRYGLPLSVLMIDIDRFKRINDAYGHPVGDQVLAYLGKLMLSVLRESDILARFGGEEMLVVAPNTHLQAAAALAERLRQHIETHELVVSSEPDRRLVIRITVSIGVAAFSTTVSTNQELVRNADQALYQAKQEGRNRVVVSADARD